MTLLIKGDCRQLELVSGGEPRGLRADPDHERLKGRVPDLRTGRDSDEGEGPKMRVAGACNATKVDAANHAPALRHRPQAPWATDLERRVPCYARALTDLGVGELLQQHYG